MRVSLSLAAALLIAPLLTGCGDDGGPSVADDPAAASEKGAGSPATDQAWTVRLVRGDGEVAGGVSYLRFVPDTGQTTVTSFDTPPEDFEPNPWLLVDAGREWAVAANAPTLAEEDAGTITLHSLTGGPEESRDLRAATGVPDLRPVGWAFDPVEPGLLRVLDTSGRLFEYAVATKTAVEGEPVEVPEGAELSPTFDSATGLPLLRDQETWETEGGGEYDAGGIEVVEPVRGLCTGDAPLTRSFVDADEVTWSACLEGETVRLGRRAEGDDDWTVVGTSAADVPSDVLELTWVLPPLA